LKLSCSVEGTYCSAGAGAHDDVERNGILIKYLQHTDMGTTHSPATIER